MYTDTFDPLEIGNERFASKQDKIIPAMTFSCEHGKVLLLALNFSDPVVRLTFESLYLLGTRQVDETEFIQMVLRAKENEYDYYELTTLLHEIRGLRVERDDLGVHFNIDIEILKSIAVLLLERGNPSFSLGFKIDEMVEVSDFSLITEEYLTNLYGETFTVMYDRITHNKDTLGFAGRYFYPEDCFIGRENLYLESMNAQSGGSFSKYTAVRELYKSDEFFSSNRDFFHQVNCACGGELVLRNNGYGQYTLLSCINPFCYAKMAYSLSDFTTAMQVDGLGAVTLMDMTRSIALKNLSINGVSKVSYSDLLNPDNALHLGNASSQLWYQFLDAIEEYDGTLKEFIELLNLPYVGTAASVVLTEPVLSDEELTANSFMKLCNKNGIKDVKGILNLWTYLPDIKYVALNLCKKINLGTPAEFKICISHGVMLQTDDRGVIKYSKKEFVKMINEELVKQGHTDVRVTRSENVTKECRVLIADQGQNTGKCQTARNYGIPIMTSREFLLNPGGV